MLRSSIGKVKSVEITTPPYGDLYPNGRFLEYFYCDSLLKVIIRKFLFFFRNYKHRVSAVFERFTSYLGRDLHNWLSMRPWRFGWKMQLGNTRVWVHWLDWNRHCKLLAHTTKIKHHILKWLHTFLLRICAHSPNSLSWSTGLMLPT